MKEGFEPPHLDYDSNVLTNWTISFCSSYVPVQLPCYDFIQIINFSMILNKLKKKFLILFLNLVKLTLCMWRAVCTRPRYIFTATCWFAITSDSTSYKRVSVYNRTKKIFEG